MRNMNLLYECADARDDYSAQRRKDRNQAGLGIFTTQDVNELDVQRVEDESVDIHTADIDNAVDVSEVSTITTDKNRMRMDEMYGLLDVLLFNEQSHIPDTRPQLDVTASDTSDWGKILSKAKDDNGVLRRSVQSTTGASVTESPNNAAAHDGTVCIISPSSCSIQSHAAFLETVDPLLFSDKDITVTMKETCAHFTLNAEQIRAFVTVAVAVVRGSADQLLMYLGGMGGTGKSQVIKALTSFFASRGERGRVMLLAPTGSAACLINGATYHSALRFGRNSSKITDAQIADVRDNLDGVDIIFID